MMNLKIEGLPFVLNYLHNPQIESYIFPVLQQTSAFSSRVFNSGGASSICKKKRRAQEFAVLHYSYIF